MRRLKRLASVAPGERCLLLRSFVWVSAIRVALWVLPLRIVRSAIPQRRDNARGDCLDDIIQAIRRASRYVPRAACLTQALAAQALLAGSNHVSRIEIGVAREGESLVAHAWLVCDGQVVLGGPDVTRYVPIASWDTKEKYLRHTRGSCD